MEHGGLILAAEPTRLLVYVGNPVRWGAFVVVWIGAALQAAHRLLAVLAGSTGSSSSA